MAKLPPRQRPRPARFEYAYICSPLSNGFTMTLNTYGQKGWELVGAISAPKSEGQPAAHLFFKRKKKGLL
jgi:hypothetical protein